MRVLVLTGSPKGPKSVTLQYARYLEVTLPGWELEVHHVAQRVKALERNPSRLEAIVARVAEADLVLWAFPVYYLLVPSQYKRFFELIEERGLTGAFADKPTATLSTSIKFHDHLPHRWLAAVLSDWGMRPVGWWSAHMQDLFDEEKRAPFEAWARETARAVAAGPAPAQPLFPTLPEGSLRYEPGARHVRAGLAGRKALILHDAGPEDDNLRAMVDRVAGALDGEVVVRSLNDVRVLGGCTGCCRCGLENQCAYQGRDDFERFYREEVMKADVLVLAGSVRTRHLSATWRRLFDRSFFMGHAPSLEGKTVAWLVAGPLSHLPEMREPYEAWTQIQHCDLVGWASDEADTSAALDDRLDAFAHTIAARARAGVVQSWDFRAEAGRLLFREEIWGRMRPIFQADHRRYLALGYYDFPTRDWRMILQRILLMALSRLPGVKERFRKGILDGMVQPYQKLLARVEDGVRVEEPSSPALVTASSHSL